MCTRESEVHARVEWQGAPEDPPTNDAPKPGVKRNKRKAAVVLAAEGRPKPPAGGRPADEGRALAPARRGGGKWCKLHRTNCHDLTMCRLVKDLAANWHKDRDERRRDDRGPPGPNGASLGFQEPQHMVAKLLWREVYTAAPARRGTQPLKWSSTPVTFDQGDHTTNTAGVGLLPVVVTPTICNIGLVGPSWTGEPASTCCPRR
jgi:hypothetical protein